MRRDFHIRLTVTGKTDPKDLLDVLRRLLTDTGVTQPDFGGFGAQTIDSDPLTVRLTFQLRAESREDLEAAVTGVEAGLMAEGIAFSEKPEILSERPVVVETGQPLAGIVYDETTAELTIETWGPWAAIGIDLVRREDRRITALVATEPQRKEAAYVVGRIIIRQQPG